MINPEENLLRAQALFDQAAAEGLTQNVCVVVAAQAVSPITVGIDYLREIDRTDRRFPEEIFHDAGLALVSKVDLSSLDPAAVMEAIETHLSQVNPKQGIMALLVASQAELLEDGEIVGHGILVIPSGVASAYGQEVPSGSRLLVDANMAYADILTITSTDRIVPFANKMALVQLTK